jgi:hypothetical protein
VLYLVTDITEEASWNLKMEAFHSSKTLITSYKTARHCNPEDRNLSRHRVMTWELTFSHGVHKSPTLHSVLRQFSEFPKYFIKLYFNIILSSTPWVSRAVSSLQVLKSYVISYFIYATCAAYLRLLDLTILTISDLYEDYESWSLSQHVIFCSLLLLPLLRANILISVFFSDTLYPL